MGDRDPRTGEILLGLLRSAVGRLRIGPGLVVDLPLPFVVLAGLRRAGTGVVDGPLRRPHVREHLAHLRRGVVRSLLRRAELPVRRRRGGGARQAESDGGDEGDEGDEAQAISRKGSPHDVRPHGSSPSCAISRRRSHGATRVHGRAMHLKSSARRNRFSRRRCGVPRFPAPSANVPGPATVAARELRRRTPFRNQNRA